MRSPCVGYSILYIGYRPLRSKTVTYRMNTSVHGGFDAAHAQLHSTDHIIRARAVILCARASN